MLHRAALVLAFAIPSIAAPVVAAAVQRGIGARDVAYVKVDDGGTFEETALKRWTQYRPDGRVFSQLEEVRRDAGAVYLYDRNRRVETILDLRNREVRGTDPGSTRHRRFYSIIDTDARRGGRDSRRDDWRDRREDWRDRRDDRRDGGRGREVEVGPIWSQSDAEQKCRDKARTMDGTWTGQWRTTVPGRMSVCEIESGTYDNSGRNDAIRDVPVGPIANQADAERTCRAEATRQRAQWTGQWYNMGRVSACQLRFR